VRASRALWLLFSHFIVYGATIPFRFAGLDGIWERAAAVPLNPLIGADTGRRVSIPDAIQNVLLFVPFGLLGVVAWYPRRPGAGRIGWIVLLAAALSASVELLQLLTVDRVAATSDVLTNTSGALLGAGIALVSVDAGRRFWAHLQWAGLADAKDLRPLLVATAVLAIAFLQPFDFSLDVGTISAKVRALEQNLWQMTGWRDEGLILLLASLFSMSLASYLAALGEPAPAGTAGLLAVAAIIPLEASQLFIGSRQPGLWDSAVAVSGAVLGVVLWMLSARVQWPFLWRAVLVAMTALAAGLQMLSPFVWMAERTPANWLPFYGYWARTTFEGLSHAIELGLAYFPVGFCLVYGARFPVRAASAALCITAAIALPIEYFQGWVVGRFPDATDILLSLAGAGAGVWAARRSET
jgi:VanZ family protein